MAREYKVISGDSHLDIAPERWVPHVPEQWRNRAPRTVRLPNGNDGLLLENRRPNTPGAQLTGTGRRYDLHDIGPITYDGPGTGSSEQRCREQDTDGIDAEVIYTHPSYVQFWRGIRDDEPFKAMIWAYNNWLGTEYCAYAPDRLLAMGVIPTTGIDDAIAELEHCAQVGLKGVALYRFPSGKNYPTPEDDRFWQQAIAMKMPLTAHTPGGTTRFTREEPIFPQVHGQGDGRGDPVSILCRFCGDTAVVPIQLALAGVFDRFPDLRIYHAETQAGWVPFALFQIDDNYDRERYKMERNLGIPPLPKPPSEYLRKHALWGFMYDRVGVQRRHEIGVDRIMWGSDFAHAQGNWPESIEIIDEIMEGVPAGERYQIVAGNAVAFFHIKWRSGMSAAKDRLSELNDWLRERGMGAYWMRGEGEGPGGPPVKPRLAKKADIYPALLKSGVLVSVGAQGMVEMRLVSAPLGSHTISLGHQILMPGERTRAHRNVKNEIRFVLEAPPEAVFVVEGEAFPMEEGDLIVAPTWTDHDHWNQGDRPSIWLDALDMGLTRFGVDVNERYPEDDQFQAIDRPRDYAVRTGGHVQPVGIPRESELPPMRYPWSETYATLLALKASEAEGDPSDGIRLLYTNPVDGGATVRTMSCEVQLLTGRMKTRTHRHSSTTLYYAHRGAGCTTVDGDRLEWEQGDLFSVPPWTWHGHENRSPDDAILFSVSDWPAMQALGFYKEESA